MHYLLSRSRVILLVALFVEVVVVVVVVVLAANLLCRRADFQMIETYRPTVAAAGQAPLTAVPVLGLGGVDDHGVTLAMLQEWAALTSGATTVAGFDGGHFFHQADGKANGLWAALTTRFSAL